MEIKFCNMVSREIKRRLRSPGPGIICGDDRRERVVGPTPRPLRRGGRRSARYRARSPPLKNNNRSLLNKKKSEKGV